MQKYLCVECHNSYESRINSDEDVIPDDEIEQCYLCNAEIAGTVSYVESVIVDDELHDMIETQIVGCQNPGCRGCGSWDSIDKEWIGRELNGTVFEAFVNVWSNVKDEGYKKLLDEVDEDSLEMDSDFNCSYCRNSLSEWHDEITIKTIMRYFDPFPELPKQLESLAITNAAERIEYFRSDCSNCLIHLTKPGSVLESVSNEDYEPVEKECNAAEILYLIISSGILKASKAHGMPVDAVCFTEKPLTALKDMLIGREAEVRSKKSGIKWFPYGLMFEKNHAIQKFNAAPALYLSDEETNFLKTNDAKFLFRVVPNTERSNFIHEREWRTPNEIRFDSEDAIVIVPTWEQEAQFRKIFDENGITVKGFLPILDVFKLI